MMKTIFNMMALVGFCIAAPVNAAEKVSFEDGALLQADTESVQIKRNEKVIFSRAVTDKPEKIEAMTRPVSKTQSAFLVSFIGETTKRLLGIRRGDAVEVLFDDAIVYRGDPGEQSATDVRIVDMDGDGTFEIVRGTLVQGVRLCGQPEAPLLFRERYDVKKKIFLPVQGMRSIKLKTSLEPVDGGIEDSLPGLQFLTADSVSSSVGDDSNPLLLTPPYSLVDHRAESGWQAGSGNGVGEFASFTTLSPQWQITAVGIDIANSTAKKSKADSDVSFAAPPSVMVSFENSAYRLRLPKESGTHWFFLPTPEKSSCLSVILEDPASQTRAPMALFEVRVQTEIHQPGGLAKLVKQLNDDGLGEQSKNVLRTLGTAAFAPISAGWKNLSPAGQRRAVRLVAEAAPKQGASLLVSAAMVNEDFIRDDVIVGLRRSNGIGEAVLAKYLKNKSDRKFVTALRMLVDMDSEAAFGALLAAANEPSRAIRNRAVIKAAAVMVTDRPVRAQQVMAAARNAKKNQQLKRMFDWLSIAVHEKTTAEEAALLAREVYDTADFENRYRALRIIALAKESFSIAFFKDVASAENQFLRYITASALASFGDSEDAVSVLTALASDEEPLVQIEALTSLLKSKSTAKQTVVKKASANPWPEVRALAVLNSVHLPKIKKQLVTQGLTDSSPMVVLEALRVSTTVHDNSLDASVTGVMTGSDNPVLQERAAQAAGARCQSDDATLSALYELLRVGAEPLADSTEKVVAVAAARSLGKIGSPTAVKHLKKAREHSNLTTDKAIDSALAAAPDGCAVKHTVR